MVVNLMADNSFHNKMVINRSALIRNFKIDSLMEVIEEIKLKAFTFK